MAPGLATPRPPMANLLPVRRVDAVNVSQTRAPPAAVRSSVPALAGVARPSRETSHGQNGRIVQIDTDHSHCHHAMACNTSKAEIVAVPGTPRHKAVNPNHCAPTTHHPRLRYIPLLYDQRHIAVQAEIWRQDPPGALLEGDDGLDVGLRHTVSKRWSSRKKWMASSGPGCGHGRGS